MSSHQKHPLFSITFAGKICFLIFWTAILPAAVAAQMTTSAAQSPKSESSEDFTIWYIAALVLGAAFCASVFWLRREKAKEPVPARRNQHARKNVEAVRKPRLQTGAAVNVYEPERSEINVDADVANWISQNINQRNAPFNKSNKSGSSFDSKTAAVVLTNDDKLNQKTRDTPVFQLSATPPPIVPLPASADEFLLEAIEQIQDFDATEEERETAVNVLSAFKSRNAVEALTTVAHYDESSRLRISALDSLGAFDHESVFEPILLTCADPAREVRAAAARALTRLSVNRGDALTRIVESGDPERLRLSAMACQDTGLASHAFNRLMHDDRNLAQEAFAMIRLLVAAGDFTAIINTITQPKDINISLATIEALRTLKPTKILPALYELTAKPNLPAEVNKALDDLIDKLITD